MGVNETLEGIAESIDVDSSLEKTGGFLDKFDFGNLMSKVGSGTSKATGFVVQKSLKMGLKLSGLSIKLITLLILVGLLYAVMHYGKKPVKYVFMALIVFLVASVIASIALGV